MNVEFTPEFSYMSMTYGSMGTIRRAWIIPFALRAVAQRLSQTPVRFNDSLRNVQTCGRLSEGINNIKEIFCIADNIPPLIHSFPHGSFANGANTIVWPFTMI